MTAPSGIQLPLPASDNNKLGDSFMMKGSDGYHKYITNTSGLQETVKKVPVMLPVALDSSTINRTGPQPVYFQNVDAVKAMKAQPDLGSPKGIFSPESRETPILGQENYPASFGVKRRISVLAAQGEQTQVMPPLTIQKTNIDPFANQIDPTIILNDTTRYREGLFSERTTKMERPPIFDSDEVTLPIPLYPHQQQPHPAWGAGKTADQFRDSFQSFRLERPTRPSNYIQPIHADSMIPSLEDQSKIYPKRPKISELASVVFPVPNNLIISGPRAPGTITPQPSMVPQNPPWVVNQVCPMEIIDEAPPAFAPPVYYDQPPQGMYHVQHAPFHVTEPTVHPAYHPQPISLARTAVESPNVDLTVDAMQPSPVAALRESYRTKETPKERDEKTTKKKENHYVSKQIILDVFYTDHPVPPPPERYNPLSPDDYLNPEDEPMPIYLDLKDRNGILKKPKNVPVFYDIEQRERELTEPYRYGYSSQGRETQNRSRSISQHNPKVYSNLLDTSKLPAGPVTATRIGSPRSSYHNAPTANDPHHFGEGQMHIHTQGGFQEEPKNASYYPLQTQPARNVLSAKPVNPLKYEFRPFDQGSSKLEGPIAPNLRLPNPNMVAPFVQV